MAGHSHAKNIMHRKAAQGAKKARAFANMTRETIDRAIRRSAQGAGGEDYQEVRYEGYGPYGVAVIVEALTDNRNRTAGDLRATFGKHGGQLAETNAVAFQFERKGVVRYPAAATGADAMLEAAVEAGAEDVDSDEEAHEVTTSVEDFFAVRDALERRFRPG